MDTKDQDYLTINQVCELMSVSRRTVYNWMGKGLVLFKLSPSGSARILKSSLLKDAEPKK